MKYCSIIADKFMNESIGGGTRGAKGALAPLEIK